ncbi:MAG: TIR domain-containing protein [Clostridiales bacterium]|nr:TIR domain-containing protein [Clostridiales bacterium]
MQIENMKCRNCGGELDYSKAVNGVLTCGFCGSKFTVPKSGANEEVRHFLLTGEHELDLGHFDEAATAYARAVELDSKEPEAFFGLALATAQVRYLKDEVNNRLQPICYSTSDKTFVQDANFKRALALATPDQKKEYEVKGKEIDAIREEFNEFRKQGLNYDTFICVKVTEESGRHTEDSHTAAQLYKELKNAGYSPFYSEEEIHGRTGVMYEAMILYALYTAQSMLLVCSDESYLQTKWVKNEYSRFLKMQRDEEKARGSLTVVFKGHAVDRIPGLNGKVQGIDFNTFNALNQVLDFVQKFRKIDVPAIKRKEYGQAKVGKIAATRKGVEKRQLATVAGGEVSASDRAKLSLVTQCLQDNDFDYARTLVDKIIADNPSNGEAYFLRLLADMSCRDEQGFTKFNAAVTNYEDFEKALASADPTRRKELYNLLYTRVETLKYVGDYEELIALPDSTKKDVEVLTDIMYQQAKKYKDAEIFDAIINTVTNTRKYIEMNLEFMNMIPAPRSDYERELKRKYCDNILSVDAANNEALWCKFRYEHSTVFGIDKSVIEESLFAYGYNDIAVKNLMQSCLSNASNTEADELFDFLLSMIPEERNSEYLASIDTYIEAKFRLKDKNLFDSISKYNERLLEADKKCDAAYFNRVMIKNGFYNPLQLIEIVDSLKEDDDYNNAMTFYLDNNPNCSESYYYVAIRELKKVRDSSSKKWLKHLYEDVYVRREELSKCSKKLKEPVQEVAATHSAPSTSSTSSYSNNSSPKHKHVYSADGPKISRILAYISLVAFIASAIIAAVLGVPLLEEGGDIVIIVFAAVLNIGLIIGMEKSKKKGCAIALVVINIFLMLAVVGTC